MVRLPLLLILAVLLIAFATIVASITGKAPHVPSTGVAFLCLGIGSLFQTIAILGVLVTGDRATFVAPAGKSDEWLLKYAGQVLRLGVAWLILGGLDLLVKTRF